ncbi:DNRLRE domain-containing protein [Streptomyces sp. NPDC056690]|uniref:DNRLRE domain-containing protein n=2 Tax=unclassified Streptomyces TaxID=2593676 RepID=UPI003684866B
MSRYTAGRSRLRRRRGRIALASALVLAAEAAFISGQAAAAPDEPTAASATASAKSPSRKEILKSDVAWAARHAKGSKAWAITQAKKTGKKVVVTDETTPTTYTVANPDGTLTTEMTTGPERVWKKGKWQKVDATLARNADGSIAAKAHPQGLRLGGQGGTPAKSLRAAQDDTARDLVTLGTDDDKVTLQWKGGLPKPELDGTRARYHDAVSGADVIVEATRTGFEQFVEIGERPNGAYSYTLPVKAKGLKAKANKDGSVTFTDAKTGTKRAVMPAPVMWDAAVDKSSGEHTHRARVDMKVINKGAGEVDLVVTPSAKFLSDPDTKFPVTVDPSTSALANTFDTYVQQGETVDWSTDTELDLGNPGTTNADGTPRTARSFITWNTTPIQDALIVDTNLALWNFHSGNTDCSAQKWTVWDTSAPSTSSRWTTQPTWKQEYHSSTQTKGNPDCASTQPDGWINADVDTLVQSWASAKVTSGHMGLRAATDDTKAWKRVNSANNAANQPKLSVTYNYRPSDGTNRQAGAPFKSYAGVWAVNTTTPTLRDTFTDPDGDKVDGTFQVYDAATNTPITTPAGDGVIVSAFVDSGKPASVTVPAGQLKDGKTYKFRTNAYDGTHYNLSWSPWTQFVVDTSAPGSPSPVASSQYPEGVRSGGASTPGTWTATTSDDANRLQYRVDGEDADPDADVPASGTWGSVNTTTGTSGTTGSFSVTPGTDGRHQVDTRAVDRADNVGESSNYGFIAGAPLPNRGGHKVDITLNKPDTGAPDPAFDASPLPAFRFDGWGTRQAKSTTIGDVTWTAKPLKQRSKQAAEVIENAPAPVTSSYSGPILDKSWCDTTLTAQKSLFTRTEACLLFQVTATGEDKKGLYRQDWEALWQIKLDAQGDVVKHWLQMTPTLSPIATQWPASPKALAWNISAGCLACSDTAKGFDWETGRSPSWSSGADDHIAQGNAETKWNGSVTNSSGSKDVDKSANLGLSLDFSMTTDTPEMVVNDRGGVITGLGSRCDTVRLPAGCVITEYSPGYALNVKKFPAAAAHAWLIQNKIEGYFYGRDAIHPLTYLPSVTRNSAGANQLGWKEGKNRYVICRGTTANRMVHPQDTGLVPELSSKNSDTKSCDEYPFNATYESAGMPKVEGGLNIKPVGAGQGSECIQTYAPKLPDGTWKLYDNLSEPAPTWDETCGRSSMSNNVNTQAMSAFGTKFAPEFRMLDKDTYWVKVAGFEDCDPSADTVKCTQRP